MGMFGDLIKNRLKELRKKLKEIQQWKQQYLQLHEFQIVDVESAQDAGLFVVN